MAERRRVDRWMASVHKDSSMPRDRSTDHKEERPAAKMAERAKPTTNVAPAKPAPSRLPMQIFVALLSIGLIVSSLLGTVIALNNKTTRRTSVLMPRCWNDPAAVADGRLAATLFLRYPTLGGLRDVRATGNSGNSTERP